MGFYERIRSDVQAYEWYETQLAGDPDYPQRVLAGYVTLELDGDTLTETLVGENGETRFSARYG